MANLEDWMHQIGFSPRFSSQLKRKRLSEEVKRRHYFQPESTIFIEGKENLVALCNFLKDSDMCRDRTGSLSEVPPTLLAATAFPEGTLRVLNVSFAFFLRVRK